MHVGESSKKLEDSQKWKTRGLALGQYGQGDRGVGASGGRRCTQQRSHG